MLVSIREIKINAGRREADPEGVQALADSISKVGLLNPITVDRAHTLIAGLHRLEAAKRLGWTEIACTVSGLEGLEAELAEIDENLIRRGLNCVDEGEQLARRKEIYEQLHPETRQGMRNGQTFKTAPSAVLETKSFAEDASEKLGIAPRTIRTKIQVAKKLTPETKKIVKSNDIGIKSALKLSRLAPKQQEEAAAQLAAGEIRTVDEYAPPAQPEEPLAEALPFSVPYSFSGKHFATFEESIADLKNPNKDCSYTPDSLLAELDSFIEKFHREFAWYSDPFCAAAFPDISQVQLDYLQKRFGTISAAIHDLVKQMKRSMKK
ncbi:chromosome partitioning protein ParB [Pseudoflavonifractor sp. 524-17]|uniref:ParB N-terminal domain-containing protein n=1 Tax=Pseudoflavonifractor sp. 524-17 TaxID=2304577 RepID=UPI00137AD428|nr:ParB N-terminal domain-containing protein [Pseudoflavonifractor sp. 524-17]NCE65102.1 chromosome partitioning protein ParB [Pseudoflavonifractor sp. 524-17]